MDFFKEKIKVIFFDLDNTLWDFDKNSKLALKEIYEEYISSIDVNNFGCRKFISIFTIHNDALWEEYRKGSVSKERLRFLRFYNTLSSMGIKNKEIINVIDPQYLTRTSFQINLISNAREVLEYLFKGHELGLITNGFLEAQKIKIENCNLEKYFKYIVVSENVGAQKPDLAIFKYALEISGADKKEIVYVGDDFNVDIKGAINAGIDSIWLNRSSSKDENIDGINYMEIKDLIELKDIF